MCQILGEIKLLNTLVFLFLLELLDLSDLRKSKTCLDFLIRPFFCIIQCLMWSMYAISELKLLQSIQTSLKQMWWL